MRVITLQHNYPIPEIGFFDSLNVPVGELEVKCRFLGAGHSLDNSLVWIPPEKILFGGCLVKTAANKGLGNSVDGNLNAWPVTIRAVQSAYPDAKIVVPGHGPSGGTELLDHTYQLLIE